MEVKRTTYQVTARRAEGWWVLSVPAIRAAHSQAKALRDVEPTARDLIALMLEVPEDSFDIEVDVQLPDEVLKHLRRAEELRIQAAEAQHDAADEARTAARLLAGLGMTVRDIGAALDVSHQRAHQLLQGAGR